MIAMRDRAIAERGKIESKLKDLMNKLNIVRGTVDEDSMGMTSTTVTTRSSTVIEEEEAPSETVTTQRTSRRSSRK
ncbi:MAG: hypothetical protein A2161_08400 [Candidatus Schekmanbacteria bacterium RBG_13_48_7]|uniref:Uncharacterized protein n=1 Tax=Candidatus Schekmanbacteria bacterium RBG_13_48_7 TaxID=1817878 RepID=A0A1F7RVU6_9BACT|nr:MAG: hypothetical protein A2161_08400 [Candidatus Schekmanbacteria bacterium RBG_13_48_7]